MIAILWFVCGLVCATLLWSVVLVFVAASISRALLPFVVMRHFSTPDSLEAYMKEHPWMFRWWSFVGWLYGV